MRVLHTVVSGECMTTLAARYGLRDAAAIHDHPDNAELKRRRPNPNVLEPGDVVVIPERELKTEPVAVDAAHRVRVRRLKKELRIVLLDAEGAPIANEPYSFTLGDADPIEGHATDGDGLLREAVPIGARSARLEIQGRVLRLHLGALGPSEGTADPQVARGAHARLSNLGYDVGDEWPAPPRRLRMAVAMFQHDHGLTVDGALSPATIRALTDAHGC